MIYSINTTQFASDFAKYANGELIGEDIELKKMSIDSREQNPGGVFLCIKGDRADGHDFAPDAAKNGAKCFITNRKLDLDPSLTQIVVKDTLEALKDIAKGIIDKLGTKVIGVTGSVGKTTTKEMISQVIGQKYNVECNRGNHNSLIGLPLSILALGERTEYAVLEMGMTCPGEISFMSKLTKPVIGVITNVGTAHLEFLKTRENIAKAKMEILDGMSEDGVLFTNGDEPLLANIKCAKYISFNSSEAYMHIYDITKAGSSSIFSATIAGEKYENIRVNGLGEHLIYDAAIAFCVGLYLGIDEKSIRRSLAKYIVPGERQKVYIAEKAGKHFTIISDCYNASPESVRASLKVLREIEGERKCAVLGDMLEIGDDSPKYHYEIGEYAKKMGISKLYATGPISKETCRGYGFTACYYPSYENVDKMTEDILSNILDNDVWLIKASHSVGLDRVLEKLL